jgi:hypothetical protein
MSLGPGLLHVLVDPGLKVSEQQFHDWYNNEHGPERMRLQVLSVIDFVAIEDLTAFLELGFVRD